MALRHPRHSLAGWDQGDSGEAGLRQCTLLTQEGLGQALGGGGSLEGA